MAPPHGLVDGLDELVRRIAVATERFGERASLRWEPLVLGRAAMLGLSRSGRRSANDSCRLLEAADGWVALNLARDDDLEMLPALLEREISGEPWDDVAVAVGASPAAAFVTRAQLFGLPAALLAAPVCGDPVRSSPLGRAIGERGVTGLNVVDLSSMWAGPLAAMILTRVGADVVKVESSARPDGARKVPGFYRWLHDPDQREIRIDFGSDAGRSQLRCLLEGADIVLESSRPRALAQLGLSPETLTMRDGAVWVSITGHGRTGSHADWVGFGDDTAVAGGLVGFGAGGAPVFCADAIADPITGLVAATAALDACGRGGGALLDVAMSRAASSVIAAEGWGEVTDLAFESGSSPGAWTLVGSGEHVEVSGPPIPTSVRV